MIWYLLGDFIKYGITYPKKAKEIANRTDIALTETYLTLRELQKKGLIWRVGKKYKYRYGLKEGQQLDNLVQLYDNLTFGQALPLHLRIESQELVELQNRIELNKGILLSEHEERIKIQKLSTHIKFLSQEEREEEISKCLFRILKFYSKRGEYTTEEEIMEFLKREFGAIFSTLYAAKTPGEN